MSAKRFGVGLLGFGTVGVGVFELLRDNGADIARRRGVDLCLGPIGVRSLDKSRPYGAELLTNSLESLVEDEGVHLVIEAMGGIEPAFGLIKRALELGKPVATANKELMAKRGAELIRIARDNGTDLRYEAAVAAGIPVLAALDRQLAANRVTRIEGILNGTTNYILSRMELEGLSFEAVLADAQALGFAEADPTADVDGFDATYKLTILASIATGRAMDWQSAERDGIRGVTAEMIASAKADGERIKLLACFDGERLSVKPTRIGADHPLYGVMGSTNGVRVSAEPVGTVSLVGPGAGAGPTASALVGDAVEMAAGLASGRTTVPYAWA